MLADTKIRHCVHEAGHVITAWHFGFLITSVRFEKGFTQTICDLDSPEKTDAERFVSLAAGVAAEIGRFNDYDKDGCVRDQAEISKRGGRQIGDYVPLASEIITSNKNRFTSLVLKLKRNWIKGEQESAFDPGWPSLMLLSSSELEEILDKLE